jgi:hypothetical protein
VYLRLVITRRDEESSRKQGVFTPAYALLDGGTLPEAERERLAAIVAWFERYLPSPDRSKLEPRTIFWFRPDSDWLMRKIWEIVEILRQNGFHVAVRGKLIEHKQYITEHGQDMPEIRDWGWGVSGQSDPHRAETG